MLTKNGKCDQMRACERVDADTNNINVIDLRVQNFIRTKNK